MAFDTLQDEVENYVRVQKILKKDFAETIGTSPAMLSHWLKGRVRFKRNTLERIKAELDKA